METQTVVGLGTKIFLGKSSSDKLLRIIPGEKSLIFVYRCTKTFFLLLPEKELYLYLHTSRVVLHVICHVVFSVDDKECCCQIEFPCIEWGKKGTGLQTINLQHTNSTHLPMDHWAFCFETLWNFSRSYIASYPSVNGVWQLRILLSNTVPPVIR